MSKHIDAEKLIAEIERQKKSIDKCPFIEAEFGALIKRDVKIKTFDEFISLITSLQQEQQEKEQEVDLEKEIEDWCDKNITGVRPIYTADSLIYSLLPKTAHHFYELGKNSK